LSLHLSLLFSQDGDVIVLGPFLHGSHDRFNLWVCRAVQHLYDFTQQIPAADQ